MKKKPNPIGSDAMRRLSDRKSGASADRVSPRRWRRLAQRHAAKSKSETTLPSIPSRLKTLAVFGLEPRSRNKNGNENLFT